MKAFTVYLAVVAAALALALYTIVPAVTANLAAVTAGL